MPDDSVLITAKTALEIGGPSEIFSTVFRVYDKIEHLDIVDFSDSSIWHPKSRSVIVSEATDLKVDGPYDLVMASHVLEHIANPLKAVLEWKRVSPGGHIVIVTPVRERTFDHNREATPFDHLLEDYNKNTGEDDLSHLAEILELHDLEMDKGAGTYEEFHARSLNNFQNRCLHHHVFDALTMKEVVEFAGLKGRGMWFIEPHHLVTLVYNPQQSG